MKKINKILIAVLVLLALAAAAATAWYVLREKPVVEEEGPQVVTNDHATAGAVYFEDEMPPADPMMLGRWRNTENPQWFKVYYDDFDEDQGLYWGKEWDESEDVMEEDLRYHGNGWFRWDKKGNELREFATMDARDVPIAKIYTVMSLTEDSMTYRDADNRGGIVSFVR